MVPCKRSILEYVYDGKTNAHDVLIATNMESFALACTTVFGLFFFFSITVFHRMGGFCTTVALITPLLLSLSAAGAQVRVGPAALHPPGPHAAASVKHLQRAQTRRDGARQPPSSPPPMNLWRFFECRSGPSLACPLGKIDLWTRSPCWMAGFVDRWTQACTFLGSIPWDEKFPTSADESVSPCRILQVASEQQTATPVA